MVNEYVRFNRNRTIDYVYEEEGIDYPIEMNSNILPYTTDVLRLETGFTLSDFMGIIENYPALESLLYNNYQSVMDMDCTPIPCNDVNYISGTYISSPVTNKSGDVVDYSQFLSLTVSCEQHGDVFCDFNHFELGELLHLPIIINQNTDLDQEQLYHAKNPPMGLFVQQVVDSISFCKVGINAD